MAVSRGGAAWSARLAHNQQVAGSNPAPATKKKAQALAELFSFAMYSLWRFQPFRFALNRRQYVLKLIC